MLCVGHHQLISVLLWHPNLTLVFLSILRNSIICTMQEKVHRYIRIPLIHTCSTFGHKIALQMTSTATTNGTYQCLYPKSPPQQKFTPIIPPLYDFHHKVFCFFVCLIVRFIKVHLDGRDSIVHNIKL